MMNLSRFSTRLYLYSAILLLLSACAGTPARSDYYDFGAVTQSDQTALRCRLPPVYLAGITASGAFSSNLMHYRLLYINDLQTRAYANSYWSMRPAELLAQRIKTQLAQSGVLLIDKGTNAPAGLQLRLELGDFSHYFSDAAHSYAQLQLRATVLRGRTLIAQTTLAQQANADAPDAPAGARAMRVATDALIVNLNNWLCEQTAM